MRTFIRTSVLLLVLTTVSAHAMHWPCCGYRKNKLAADYVKEFTNITLKLCEINAKKKKRKQAPLALISVKGITETIDLVFQNTKNLKKESESVHNFFDAAQKLLPYYKPNEMLRSKNDEELRQLSDNFFVLHTVSPSYEYESTKKEYEQLQRSLAEGLKRWNELS